MRKQVLATLALLAVAIFFSGCTGLTTTGGGTGVAAGVIIKEFRPDISEIYAGDQTSFYLTVENVGESDATEVSAKFFGLGTDWTTVPQTEPIGELTRSQPEFNVPGGVADTIFTVTSPTNARGPYQASVRVTYGYSTVATGQLKVYNNEYLKTIPQQSETIMKSSALESFTVKSAPVSIALAGVARPLVYRGNATNTATITVQISNKGQGYPYLGVDTDGRKVKVDSVKINNANCNNTFVATPTIPRDGSASFACKFKIPAVGEYQVIPIEISISYNYYVDATSSIKVLEQVG